MESTSETYCDLEDSKITGNTTGTAKESSPGTDSDLDGSRITGNETETDMESSSETEIDMESSSETEIDMESSSETEADMESSSGTETDMESSSETETDMESINYFNNYNGPIIRLPSTSTENTDPIMPLEFETLGEQHGEVNECLNPPSSTEKEELDNAVQAINASIQPLLSGLKQCNVSILDIKEAHETLLNRLNRLAMPSKDLVDAFESLTASKNKIQFKKMDELRPLIAIQKAMKKITGIYDNPSLVDGEDVLGNVSPVIESILDQQKAQNSLLVEIQELSNTISKKLHVNVTVERIEESIKQISE